MGLGYPCKKDGSAGFGVFVNPRCTLNANKEKPAGAGL